MSLATYLMIAAMVSVASTVGVFRTNYAKSAAKGESFEYVFAVSAISGLVIGLLWPLAILAFIAGRIIYHTTLKGKRP